MISLFLWCHFKTSEDHYYTDTIARPSYQHFGNDVIIKVGISMVMYIHIAICIISVGINSDISKFKQLECSTLSLYCTVSFTGCSAKKTLKSLLHWERLRITQETLQISLFASVFKFSKENCFALPFYCAVLCAGCSTKEGLNHILHREFLRKNQETLQISVSLVKNVSYFLSVYCTALGTDRLEPPH